MFEYQDIHKQARIMEGELDLKLTHFNKLCSVQKPEIGFPTVHRPSSPSEIAVDAATYEILDLIGKLDRLNKKMWDVTGECDRVSVKHTMKRHGEILLDYRKEFLKIQENFKAAKERQILLESNKKNTGNHCKEESAASVEQDHLLRSELMIDGQLHLAQETRLQLLSQRKSMKKLHTRLRSLYHRFPVMNDLIRRAELSRQKRFVALAIITMLILAFIYTRGKA